MVTKLVTSQIYSHVKATTLFLSVAFSVLVFSVPQVVLADLFIKETIQKAQELTVKRDRQKVSQLFVKAIEKEGRTSANSQELQLRFKQLIGFFYTEKGQQTFELGETLLSSDVPGAIEKYKEALKLEEGNTSIYFAVAKAYIKSADCKSSLEMATRAREWNPFDENLVLLQLQSLACLRKTEEFQKVLTQEEKYLKSLQLYVQVSKAQNYINQEEYILAETELNKAKELDDKYPEVYYWLGEIERTKTVKVWDSYKKYAELCKSGLNEISKKYGREPRVCLEYKNVVSILSKSENK